MNLKNKNYQLKRNYGLTLKEFDDKLKSQKNGCWICGSQGKTRSLHVDHKHIKNYKKKSVEEKRKYVRGLLCFRCNVLIGKIERYKESWNKILRQCLKYLKYYQ